MRNKRQHTYISLFSSAGVGCFGFKEENFKCVATNEIIERRLNIQKINNKCELETGYICGDIQNEETKEKIYNETKKWSDNQKNYIDVVIATPPCQGMSVANHKKKTDEINRNSLVNESVEIIKKIQPKFFIFENVSAFWKTGCINKNKEVVSIGEMIMEELGKEYSIYKNVINFKDYGSNSSRTRTLVIGVLNKFSDEIAPVELFPDYKDGRNLKEIISDMSSLKWGEYDKNDFYHSFRIYPEHMRKWIKEINEGESAFDNREDLKKPHKIINGEIVINQSKNGDKYRRQIFDKVAPCIHTRNDQIASQNTIHPREDRVFSIRELMKMMTIPDNFKWLDLELEELNSLTLEEKRKISKREEMNIRQSIGEAVPTEIFRQIARKINNFLEKDSLSELEIKKISTKLKTKKDRERFIEKNFKNYNFSTLSKIIELSNSKRKKHSAYYTNKFIIQEIFKQLPNFDNKEITILEPSVGIGNFIPFIFKKYENISKVNLKLIDIDKNILEILKLLISKIEVPENFNIEFINKDFLDYSETEKVDLVVGNPPFTKLSGNYLKEKIKKNYNKETKNLAELILEKAMKIADNVSLIMPKNILNTPEYEKTREILSKKKVESIIDFGEKGFKDVLIETINLAINMKLPPKKTEIISITRKEQVIQNQNYIFDQKLPYWIIYRNFGFDKIYGKMIFGVFEVFRDRQITNSNSHIGKLSDNDIRVIKSRNISNDGEIVNIENYDAYINKNDLKNFQVKKYLNDEKVYLTPNMTYNPRLMKKEKGYIVNGSVAILIPKYEFELTEAQKRYISSDEFRTFYKIARNYQTRSLNIDKTSCYWFGINLEV